MSEQDKLNNIFHTDICVLEKRIDVLINIINAMRGHGTALEQLEAAQNFNFLATTRVSLNKYWG